MQPQLSVPDVLCLPQRSLIVVASAQLAYNNSGAFTSALTPAQWAYLEDYEATYRVRRVSMDDYPGAATGTQVYNTTVGKTVLSVQNITLNATYASAAGVQPTADVDTNGLFHTPAVVSASLPSTISSVAPVFWYNPCPPEFPVTTVGAVHVTYSNYREHMAFFLAFGSWSATSSLLNHVWLQWGTRGLYQGFRRTYALGQVDDLFLKTETVFNSAQTYRVTPEDMANLAAWQASLNRRLPRGSAFRVEVALNGNGILEAAGSADLININTESTVNKTYVKPLGSGTNRWPSSYTSSWVTNSTGLLKDALFAWFVQNKTANMAPFSWLSHTFTHENLDDATQYDVTQEVTLNQKMATVLGLTGQPYWSSNGMVTPEISGVFNGDAYTVLTANNITTIVGDNSRSQLVPSDIYGLWRSTSASSNYVGYAVIPRQPTEVYYDCSTVAEDIYLYNNMYFNTFGYNSTWSQILSREQTRLTSMLLNLRHDPHMFHQANLRNHDLARVIINRISGRWGLYEQWFETVFARYNQLVTWPVVSLKMDDLAQFYREREARTTCSISTSFTVSTYQVTGVTISTSGACKVGITIPTNVTSVNPAHSYEQLGSDPLTVWVPMTSGTPVTIPVNAVKWGDRPVAM
ncbi:hypothetical protein M427DRAFT_107155 [Gonapodya prolifera JEL478]|uniref:Uncharacterized protein n=1 Tax=Gonapodya prolifera (strain JEL478) TaxID=1344416 RepID=A0A139AZ55_GONPJ|nr:hypothetical protein M427DRAFT_107155 [Gonapodya prolifera JEL478]|eukprot:KXS21755.1 hypothetical protein M427DRAFT_107155 [Gonapodya prolifera JEL478]